MPPLFRILFVLTVLSGGGLGTMYAFATLVVPDACEIIAPVPADRLTAAER